jgi:hypothetical protein
MEVILKLYSNRLLIGYCAICILIVLSVLSGIYLREGTMENGGWKKDNMENLLTFMVHNECRNNCEEPPVAIFDWDNTVVFNDIGDYFFNWMMENDLFKFNDWRETSPYLTEESIKFLKENCKIEDGFIKGSDIKCFNAMSRIYNDGKLPDNTPAFAGYDPDIYQPAYAWLGHLLAGYRVEDLEKLCAMAVSEAVKEEAVTIYPQMEWLIYKLQEKGFHVEIITASPKILVVPFANYLGIHEDNVSGIENVIKDGVITADFIGCGTFKDGENKIMTYKKGKRCKMNEKIFGITGSKALEPATDLSKRPLFGAGDSDTDYHFMIDVTGLRLLINRNTPMITKEAEENKDGRWIINEPFFVNREL